MRLVSFLYSGSPFAEYLKNFMLRLNLQYFYNIRLMKNLEKSPSSEMLKSREFYSKNQDRVTFVYSLLSDDESRDVFTKIINLRQFYCKKDIPHYNYFNQYYPKDIITLSDSEVFVDCGAFNVDSIKAFIKRAKKYKALVAFEPEKNNLDLLKHKLKRTHDLRIIEAGVWNENGCLNFAPAGGGSSLSQDSDNGTYSVKTVRIDDCEESRDCTFIKMDIEGAELPALKGAEETIKRNKPKLAICIYHSDEDMLCIAEYIHSIVPEYKLYVRAHTMGIAETVLYAVV